MQPENLNQFQDSRIFRNVNDLINSSELEIKIDTSCIEHYEKIIKSLPEMDKATQLFIRTNLGEVNISLFNRNKSDLLTMFHSFEKMKNMDQLVYNFHAFFEAVTKYKNLEEAQKELSEIHLKIIRKKLEDSYGYPAYLKLTNFNLFQKLIEKFKTAQPNIEPILEQEKKREAERANNLQYQPMSDVTWEKVYGLAFDLRRRFSVIDIRIPLRMSKEHAYFWLGKLVGDLETVSKFLKIPEHKMCKFKVVLGANSRFGHNSFSVDEGIMYLNDTNPTHFIHEWFHYFDYKIGSYIHQSMKYYNIDVPLTYWSNMPSHEGFENIEDGCVILLAEFMKLFIPTTPYFEKIQNNDKNQGEKYWTKEVEIMARGFEVWIAEELKNNIRVVGNKNIDTSVDIYPSGNSKQMTVHFWNKNWNAVRDAYLRAHEYYVA